MRDQTSDIDGAQLSQALIEALAGSWQGRAVSAQLRTDPTAGSESLRALLTEAPPSPLDALVAWYGVDALVRAAGTTRRRRSRRLVIAGSALVVVAAATVVALLVTSGSGTGSATIPLAAPSESPHPRPSTAAADVRPTPAGPAGVGPVVGDINDPDVQTTIDRRLASARWVPFARDGFFYRARAVMVHSPTDGADSAPPNFHKLVFLVEVFNLQKDRPAPLSVGQTTLGDLIDVPRRLADGCRYPFSTLAAASEDRCTMRVVTYGAQTYEHQQIPANDSLGVAVEAQSNVPDSIPDSEVKLYMQDEKGPRFEDISYVDVPLN